MNSPNEQGIKIAILGCGAIGGLFLGYLSKEKHDVIGIVRDYQKETLTKKGLIIERLGQKKKYEVKVSTKLKEKVDLAIFATKTNDLDKLAEENIGHLEDSTILTTQNGIRADSILNKYFPKEKIITGIVMFGATFYSPNRIMHNFEGDLILGNIFGAKVDRVEEIKDFLTPTFNAKVLNNIKGAKYLKLFINLNNCIPACLGLSMQEVFNDLDCAKLAIRLNKEAHDIVSKSNIELVSLPTYSKDKIAGLVSMKVDEAAGIFSKIMTSLSKEPLYGSILQSIKRGKKSEIDYINGEIIQLAKDNILEAPINKKIVTAIHKVENSGKFFNKEELFQYLNN